MEENMENFRNNDLPEFTSPELQEFVNGLKGVFNKQQNNFAEMCYFVHKIWFYCKNSYVPAKDGNFYNAYLILEKFGFDKRAVSRLVSCYKRFCFTRKTSLLEKEVVLMDDIYVNFSPSKLFELLPLSSDSCFSAIHDGKIKASMTVKEIRQQVKFLIHGGIENEKQPADSVIEDEINEEEIPMAYDPTKEYDFEYFKEKTKPQLLNIVMALQKEYQKLKNKKASK